LHAERPSLWWRAGIAALVFGVFWVDFRASEDFVVPMFYVLPTLLLMWSGRCWEPAVVAGVATVLTAIGLRIDNPAGIPTVAVVNRSLEIVGIWLAAGVVTLHRVLVLRSERQAERERAQREIAEKRLREQSALTQLGQLAAVVAHEVRNPLAGVRGSLQVLGSRLPAEARDRDVIAAMIQRLDALNAKVTDLLIYVRPTEPRIQDVELRPLVIDAGASAQAAMGSIARPVVVSGDSPVARADPEMLRPALLNLLLNAYQAGGTGEIDVRIAAADRTATVAIMDRGSGIPPASRERVFEPFYTTKPGGTGLGLPVVSRLLQLQGGALALRDRAGGGTIAELTLPAA
jgi:signal transduction histidine kinase